MDLVFDFLDLNNNGSIEKEEFKIFDKEQIGRGPSSLASQEVLRLVRGENNRLHLSKLCIFVLNKLKDKYNRSLAKAFNSFDSDKDGVVSKKEFSSGLEALNIKLKKEDFNLFFDHMDLDRDGYVSLNEFLQLDKEQRVNVGSGDDTQGLAQKQQHLQKCLVNLRAALVEKYGSLEDAFKNLKDGESRIDQHRFC